MGKALIDFDDIQAEENRRREVAVKAGASPRATKVEPSPLKDMIAKAVQEQIPAVSEEFTEYKKNTPLPGYNFVSTPLAFQQAEDVIKQNKDALKAAEKEQNVQTDLQAQARENELKVTRTSTGQPKVEGGEEVKPIQQGEDLNVAKQPAPAVNTPVANVGKNTTTPNPSPVGSGDARAAANVASDKGGETDSGKK